MKLFGSRPTTFYIKVWKFDDLYEFVGLVGSSDPRDITNLGVIAFGCRNGNRRIELVEFAPTQASAPTHTSSNITTSMSKSDLANDWYGLCSKYASLFVNDCNVSKF